MARARDGGVPPGDDVEEISAYSSGLALSIRAPV
jgi:hypothetical protein